MGILVSLLSKKIVKIFKTELNTILVGLLIFIAVNFFLTSTNVLFLFVMLFIFCIGMFTVHTMSTGLANSMKGEQKSLTSGMYLTFYYLGGAMGSFLPSIIYEHLGWNIMVYSFIFIIFLMLILVYRNKKLFD